MIELTAIQISGAAGLLLAAGIIAPGRLRRIDALKRNARRAGVLIIGVIAMLVVAGTIEGFFSPLRTPPELRLAVGALTALGLIAYFGLAGRGDARRLRERSRRDNLASSRVTGSRVAGVGGVARPRGGRRVRQNLAGCSRWCAGRSRGKWTSCR